MNYKDVDLKLGDWIQIEIGGEVVVGEVVLRRKIADEALREKWCLTLLKTAEQPKLKSSYMYFRLDESGCRSIIKSQDGIDTEHTITEKDYGFYGMWLTSDVTSLKIIYSIQTLIQDINKELNL